MQLKKVSFFKKFIDSIRVARLDKQSIAIISALKKHPKFPVDKSDYVKYSAHFMCENDPDLCVFFADCDNLRIANEMAEIKAKEINSEMAESMGLSDISELPDPITGEEIVDQDIRCVLSKIKEINTEYGYNSALLGLQGDEIFIAIPHIKQEDIQKLYDSYSEIQSGLITISVGYCNDMSQGVESAFVKAEKASKEVKLKKKNTNRKTIFKDDADKVLSEELKGLLSQLRINVENLNQQQKQSLKTNISSSFKESLKTTDSIISDVKSSLLESPEENSIAQTIAKLDNKFSTTCSIYPEQRMHLIIAQVLSQTPVEGIPKLEYFLHQQLAHSLPHSKKATLNRYSDARLATIEFSGIKDINDTYGYTECDQRVYQNLTKIQELISTSGIKTLTPIFSRHISSHGFLISEDQLSKFEQLSNDIDLMPSDFKISITSTGLVENLNPNAMTSILNNEKKSSMDVFRYLLDSAECVNRQKNAQVISEKKVNDKVPILRYISTHLRSISETVGVPLTPQLIDSALNQLLSLDDSNSEALPEIKSKESVKNSERDI